MELLCFDLSWDVHRDFIKFELQGFYLLRDLLYSFYLRLYIWSLANFLNYETNFLGLFVHGCPAQFYVWLVLRLNGLLVRALILSLRQVSLPLPRREHDLVLVDARDRPVYLDALCSEIWCQSDARGLSHGKSHLQGACLLEKQDQRHSKKN